MCIVCLLEHKGGVQRRGTSFRQPRARSFRCRTSRAIFPPAGRAMTKPTRNSGKPVLVALSVLFSAAPVVAAGELGQNGSAITTSSYSLDLFQGPIFAGSRVTSLAGAYVAIAEDVDGDLQNPAAP